MEYAVYSVSEAHRGIKRRGSREVVYALVCLTADLPQFWQSLKECFSRIIAKGKDEGKIRPGKDNANKQKPLK